MNERTRKRTLMIAAAAVTAVALWLSFRNVEWTAFRGAFARVNAAWVAASVLNSLFAVYALGWRWRILLAPRAQVPMRTLFRLNIVAQVANILMPARANEVVRTWLTSREAGIPAGFVMGTIAIERIFDVVVYAAVLVASPALLDAGRGILPPSAAHVSGALAVLVLMAFVLRPGVFLKAAGGAAKALPVRRRGKAYGFIAGAVEAFGALRSARTATVVAALSALTLFVQVLTVWLVFRAFGFGLPIGAAVFVLLIRQLGNIAPAAPGRIGIFEYTVVVALAAFGVPRSPALSYAVLLHLVAQVPKIVLGLAFVPRFRAGGGPGASFLTIRRNHDITSEEGPK